MCSVLSSLIDYNIIKFCHLPIWKSTSHIPKGNVICMYIAFIFHDITIEKFETCRGGINVSLWSQMLYLLWLLPQLKYTSAL